MEKPKLANAVQLKIRYHYDCMGLASKVAKGQGTNEFSIVAPAKAGLQRALVNIERQHSEKLSWIPAQTGMTVHLVDAKFIVLRQGRLYGFGSISVHHIAGKF